MADIVAAAAQCVVSPWLLVSQGRLISHTAYPHRRILGVAVTDPALSVRFPYFYFYFNYTDNSRAAFTQVYLDSTDALAPLRNEFHVPTHGQMPPGCANPATPNDPVIYLCGNSLGLQPKGTARLVYEELNKWAARCVNCACCCVDA
jgi:hypothetical protein